MNESGSVYITMPRKSTLNSRNSNVRESPIQLRHVENQI